MNGVMIVPTGLGAEIGGHAGDANPACKLLAGCCDTLVTHPNVVNASDINEMPENVLYVEGSQLDSFLEGRINLEPVRTYNKILLVCNAPVTNKTVNAVNAARHTIGADIETLELTVPLEMNAYYNKGVAAGQVLGVKELALQIADRRFDALAVHTPISVNRDVALKYYKVGGINPWGGVEALASRGIAYHIGKPVAHAPLENVQPDDKDLYFVFEQEVKPRIAAEAISNCYLHCVLKGLHKAPRIVRLGLPLRQDSFTFRDIDFMASPYGCWGRPHDACVEANIPIIVVRENSVSCTAERLSCNGQGYSGNFKIVENYWEAAGYIMAMRSGIKPSSVRS
jgi:hypothetical protein